MQTSTSIICCGKSGFQATGLPDSLQANRSSQQQDRIGLPLVKPPEICGNPDGRDWFDERSFDGWIDSLSDLGDLPTRQRLHCSKSGSPMTRFHFAS
uniref:Uncharacterized protein n=1 Tax=uncultured planctomycete 8FN TaxID=455070 RepID=A9LH18_9BACT|nr:hypothetical protein 8FN_17 [uncultured planctomycete 8FN]